MPPAIRYTRSDGVRLAYQVHGEGDVDLLFVPGIASHLELQWGDPAYARFMRRLASFSRVITFDRRGIGMSDRVARPTTMEERVKDISAIVDASGAERPVMLGFSDGGLETLLYTATYPERTRGLIACCTAPSAYPDEEQPGFVRPEMRAQLNYVIEHWGDGWNYTLYAPTLAGSKMQRRLLAVFERSAARRDDLIQHLQGALSANVKHVLPSISVPALVLHRSDDFIPLASGRFLADRIPRSKFVVIKGADHVPFAGNANVFLTEIEDFVRSVSGQNTSRERPFRSIVATRPSPATARDLVRLNNFLDSTARRLGGSLKSFNPETQIVIAPGADAAIEMARSFTASPLIEAAGIHGGEVDLVEDGVVGASAHFAARVMQLAKEGEILVSDAAWGLLRSDLYELVDAGTFELKGLPGRHRLRRLVGGEIEKARAEPWRASVVDRFMAASIRLSPWPSRALMRITAWPKKKSLLPVARSTR